MHSVSYRAYYYTLNFCFTIVITKDVKKNPSFLRLVKTAVAGEDTDPLQIDDRQKKHFK